MKKKILLLSIISLMLFSCSTKQDSFDADFSIIINALKDDANAINTLTMDENADYIYKLEGIDLKIRSYYKEDKTNLRYIFVLNFDYVSTDIKNIRIASICINDKNSIIGQVGFDGKRKTISSYNDASNDIYKGIQIFLNPYIKEESIIRFYFECDSAIGKFYQITDLKEYE